MNILLIGGTGLISTGITRLLLERGDTIWHFNRGKRDANFGERINTVLGDRYDHAAFENAMQSLPVMDAVIEMIGYSLADAESLVRAWDGRCGHLLFCSTVDVYARPASVYPVTDTEPFRPAAWDYAEKKAQMETFFAANRATLKQPFTVLRPAHTYDDGGAMLHAFGGGSYHLDRLMKGKPIIVPGDGQSLWSSCHRDDIAPAFVNALGNETAFGKGYSLPGHECVTWNQIHAKVADSIGAPAPTLVHIPTDLLYAVDKRAFISAINFSYNNIFDTANARADLGFDPEIMLSEGANRIYRNLLERNKLENSDDVPQDDAILAAWERLTERMKEELAV